jgi:hypothetical protein
MYARLDHAFAIGRKCLGDTPNFIGLSHVRPLR